MDLDTGLWAFELALRDSEPLDPRFGLLPSAVSLGSWWSPEGFPWDVSLVLIPWGKRDRVTVEDGILTEVPSLLLHPRPWARPAGGRAEQALEWVKSMSTERPKATSGEATWEPLDPDPSSAAQVWSETLAATERIAAHALGATSVRAREGRLRDLARDAPWFLALSRPLLAELQAVLGLGGEVAPRDVLAASHEWARQTDTTRQKRAVWGVPDASQLSVGLFECLVRKGGSDGPSQAAISMGLRPKGGNGKEAYDAHYEWRTRLTERGVRPLLIPLPTPTFDEVLRIYDAGRLGWVERWLAAEGRHQLLRLVFGRQVDRFVWNAERDKGAGPAGLNCFASPEWACEVRVVADPVVPGSRVAWRRRDEAGLTAPPPSA